MRLHRAVTVLLLLLALGGFVVPAQAVDQTTKWFTVMAQEPNGGAPLFLTFSPDGLTFEPYVSGDTKQMWTMVNIDYPTIPRVTSDSGIDIGAFGGAVVGCFANLFNGGCPFSVTLGTVVKVVGRAGQGCLVFGPHYYAVTRPCLVNSPDEGYQLWRVYSADRAAVTFTARSGDGNSLAADAVRRRGDALALAGSAKTPGQVAHFVLQLAAEVSCTTDAWKVCFRQQ